MHPDCKIDLRSRGICVIIPTYNNAGTIADVVTRTQEYCSDVFVVLDGCTDNTLSVLDALPDKPNLVVLPKNRGKGIALKKGFKSARAAGFAFAITLDADGQHYPEDIPLFLEANRRNPDAIVVGKRLGLDKAERSNGSKFANWFSNLWFFLQTFVPLKDTQTGYRLYPLKRMGCLSLLTSRYEAELELLVFAAWRGVRIVSQDVRVLYPAKEERVSHFRPFYDFTRISLLNTVLCILAVIYGLPRTFIRLLLRAIKTLSLFLFFVVLAGFLVTPAVFVYLNIGKVTEKKKKVLHRIICRVFRLCSWILKCSGNKSTLAGNVGEDFAKPSIIICNHQSVLDLLQVLSQTPNIVILTAKWVWNNPFFGYIIRNADFLPAYEGLEAMVPRLQELVDQGYSVAVFPEGTRSLDRRIGRFHQGAFYLADKLNLDILPMVVYGTGGALPKHAKLLKRWPMLLEIENRITREEISNYGDTYKSQASSLRKYYIARYSEIADRIEQTLK